MSTVVSALVNAFVDQMGNPRTEAWLTLEFGEAYQGDGGYAGGIAFDLSPYFSLIDNALAQPISGSTLRDLVSGETRFFHSGSHVFATPVVGDYGTPTSARFQLWGASTPTPLLSGNILSGRGITQLVSGPAGAISGIRFLAKVIGY